MAPPPKTLLSGDVSGDLKQLFKRVVSVNKSAAGPFDALLCVGQFFPDSADQLDEFNDSIEDRAQIPLPTYFIGDYGVSAAKVLLAAMTDAGNQGFKLDGLKVCDNLYWLKGSGKFTLHGLSVAYLSGQQYSDSQQFGTYNQDDVDVLQAIAEEPGILDLFLTLADIHLSQTLRKAGALCTGYDLYSTSKCYNKKQIYWLRRFHPFGFLFNGSPQMLLEDVFRSLSLVVMS